MSGLLANRSQLLLAAHVLAAIFATWRLTELFTVDRLLQKLRDRYPTYLLRCSRCISVWAAIAATLMLGFAPWLNWPFALAYFYLAHLEATALKRVEQYGRRFSITVKRDGKYETVNDFNPQELQTLLNLVFPSKPNGLDVNP